MRLQTLINYLLIGSESWKRATQTGNLEGFYKFHTVSRGVVGE